MPRVVHFEIHADDPQRAANFYQNVFGWQINKWEGPEDYWLVTTGADNEPGINGASNLARCWLTASPQNLPAPESLS